MFIACIIHAFVVFIVTLLLHYINLETLTSWAYFLGILGTLLATIQFLPQIWTTWQLQAVESLSIPMMCIQTPGSFVWVASLAGRLGWAGWSTWGIYLVTGVLQGCLLVMGICFESRNRRKAQATVQENHSNVSFENDLLADGNEPDEHTRLVGNET